MKTVFSIFTAIGMALGIIHGANSVHPKDVKPVVVLSPTFTPTPSPCSNGVNQSEQALQGSCITTTPTLMPKRIYYYDTYTPTPSPEEDSYMYKNRYNDTELPTPTPVHEPVTCTTNGNFTSCSNGITYTTNGNYTHGSDGSSATQMGNTTFINGGTNVNSGSCTKNGIYSNCTDGSSSTELGNTTYIHGDSGTTTCTHFGNTTNCN